MMATKEHDRFRELLTRVYAAKTEQIADQVDFDDKYQHLFSKEYKELSSIVLGMKKGSNLEELMNIYLQLYHKYSYNSNNTHFSQSDQLFQTIVEHSLNKNLSADKGDTFELWDKILFSDKEPSLLRKRFSELDRSVQSKLRNFFIQGREKKRGQKSILDTLKNEYKKQWGPLKSNDDLYHFDPAASDSLKSGFATNIENVLKIWNVQKKIFDKTNVNFLELGLQNLKYYISKCTSKDPLVLFQLIKYLQDFFVIRKEPLKNMNTGERGTKKPLTDLHESIFYSCVYQMVCIRLMEVGRNVRHYVKNRYGFTDEELAYLIMPIRDSGFLYVSNVEQVISTRIRDNNTLPNLYNVVKLFMEAHMLTQCQLDGLSLVDWKKTQEIQTVWREIRDLTILIRARPKNVQATVDDPRNEQALQYLKIVSETSLEVNPRGANLSRATLRAGNGFGTHSKYGDVSIVYLDPAEPTKVYVEFATLKPLLFVTTPGYVADKFYGSMIMEIHKSTIGIVYINNMILQAMIFMPTLIEYGFGGLMYEIISFYVSEKIENAASLLHPLLGKLVSLPLMALGPKAKTPGPKSVGQQLPVVKKSPFKITEVTVEHSLEDIIAKHEQLALQRSRGIPGRLKEKFAEGVEKTKNLTDRAIEMKNNVLGYPAKMKAAISERYLSRSERNLAYAGAGMERSAQSGPGIHMPGRGTGGRGTSSRIMADEAKLKNSQVFKKLDEYRDYLIGENAKKINDKVSAIIGDLRKGLPYSKARERIETLITSAKEYTGEIAAEHLIMSNHLKKNFKIIKKIPRRGKDGVVMLDMVYEVKEAGKTRLILIEVKGGQRTELGKVNAYTYEFKPDPDVPGGIAIIRTRDGTRMIKQASGEWYYQRIYEIYLKDRDLAKRIFDAFKNKEVETIIVKSGTPSSPSVTWDTGFVSKFFDDKIWLKN